MIFVDTGFFLALSQPADALHSRALSWAGAVSDKLLTTEYVLWETVNALSRPIDRPRVHRLVTLVNSSALYEVVVASPSLFNEGLEYHKQRADKEWSLTDCISSLLMEQRGIHDALAHDQHFAQAGFSVMLRQDPPTD